MICRVGSNELYFSAFSFLQHPSNVGDFLSMEHPTTLVMLQRLHSAAVGCGRLGDIYIDVHSLQDPAHSF